MKLIIQEELRLYRRGREFSIRVNGCELMNSRPHGSEEALAELAARILQAEQRAHDASRCTKQF
ncbi:MAG: hypothetical protein A2V87_08765 [Deltaproteobacteria bacterium RBG_16_58_17]|nr:MAG: hypothetical protein A2V87_08765 [Deltaproteobacteria bacterium RBG_16_58_17]OHE18618.1 MAG: hypothetical protein A2X96_03075 [Syntrophobacterales bacterium GWC2_56_13]OHE20824.1 MAG: hypothetical protein A2X95_09170 [Syntrophobacterales bacterium GWF2_56_9]